MRICFSALGSSPWSIYKDPIAAASIHCYFGPDCCLMQCTGLSCRFIVALAAQHLIVRMALSEADACAGLCSRTPFRSPSETLTPLCGADDKDGAPGPAAGDYRGRDRGSCGGTNLRFVTSSTLPKRITNSNISLSSTNQGWYPRRERVSIPIIIIIIIIIIIHHLFILIILFILNYFQDVHGQARVAPRLQAALVLLAKQRPNDARRTAIACLRDYRMRVCTASTTLYKHIIYC